MKYKKTLLVTLVGPLFLSGCNSGGINVTSQKLSTTSLTLVGPSSSEKEVADLAPERNFIPMLSSQYYSPAQKEMFATSCGGAIIHSKNSGTYLITALHCVDKRDYDDMFKNKKYNYSFTLENLDIILPKARFSSHIKFSNACFPSPVAGYDWIIKGSEAYGDSFTKCPNSDQTGQKQISAGFLPGNDIVKNYSIDKFFIHPKINGLNPDIVIAKIADDADFQSDKTVLTIADGKNYNSGEISTYGWSHSTTSNGVLNFVNVAIDSQLINSTQEFLTLPDKVELAPGDSGSPTIHKLPDGSFKLVGISSFVTDSDKVSTSYITNILKYTGWIDSVINQTPTANTIVCKIKIPCSINQ